MAAGSLKTQKSAVGFVEEIDIKEIDFGQVSFALTKQFPTNLLIDYFQLCVFFTYFSPPHTTFSSGCNSVTLIHSRLTLSPIQQIGLRVTAVSLVSLNPCHTST